MNAITTIDIKKISDDAAIEKVVSTVKEYDAGEAPFAIVVGAGFSHGLVPTADEFVRRVLPNLDDSFVYQPFKPRAQIFQINEEMRSQEQHEAVQSELRAISFWKRFVRENKSIQLT